MTTSSQRARPGFGTWGPLMVGCVALLLAVIAVAVTLTRAPASGLAGASTPTTSGIIRGQPGLLHPRDAALPPALGGTTHELSLVATETQQEIAPGVTYAVWTFGDQAPGPTLRVRQGDTIQFTLRNGGQVAHSIDFHAAQTPWDQNYHSVNPGETISFTWQANYPGAFLYHCGTAPALMHIANGMYGAVIVDPAEPLLPAKEFVLVQSEFYAQPAADRTRNEGDYAKMLADAPDFVVFNGVAQQYMQHPLQADPGERLRFWVVNAGPSQPSAFHVVGAILDRVYPDGNPANAWQGMQTYNIPPGGGAMVELTVPDEGLYPIVSHSFASATKGALAMLRVGNPPGAPEAASH